MESELKILKKNGWYVSGIAPIDLHTVLIASFRMIYPRSLAAEKLETKFGGEDGELERACFMREPEVGIPPPLILSSKLFTKLFSSMFLMPP